MSRDKYIAIVLAALILLPVLYDIGTSPDWSSDALLTQMAENRDSLVSGDAGWTSYLSLGLYGGALLGTGICLLFNTDSVLTRYRWLWVGFLVLLPPVAAMALVYRVLRGRPFLIPRTLEEQRKILRENVAQLQDSRK